MDMKTGFIVQIKALNLPIPLSKNKVSDIRSSSEQYLGNTNTEEHET